MSEQLESGDHWLYRLRRRGADPVVAGTSACARLLRSFRRRRPGRR